MLRLVGGGRSGEDAMPLTEFLFIYLMHFRIIIWEKDVRFEIVNRLSNCSYVFSVMFKHV